MELNNCPDHVAIFLKCIYFWLRWILVATLRPSCPETCGILDAQSEIKPTSPDQEVDSQQLDHEGSPL